MQAACRGHLARQHIAQALQRARRQDVGLAAGPSSGDADSADADDWLSAEAFMPEVMPWYHRGAEKRTSIIFGMAVRADAGKRILLRGLPGNLVSWRPCKASLDPVQAIMAYCLSCCSCHGRSIQDQLCTVMDKPGLRFHKQTCPV